jgi:DNA-directed RNA polymerase beta' subunit
MTKRKLTENEINNILNKLILRQKQSQVLDLALENHKNDLLKDLKKIEIKETKIQKLTDILIKQFYKSLIAPGEAVGINAAQCISEPTTQGTLNSIAGETEIIFLNPKGNIIITTIGKFVDDLLEKNADKIVKFPENCTEYLELNDIYKIVTIDFSGKIFWENMTAITRHYPVGGTFKISCENGINVVVSASKSLLIKNEDGIFEQKSVDKVKIDNKMPVIEYWPKCSELIKEIDIIEIMGDIHNYPKKLLLDYGLGQLIGLYINCGVIDGNYIYFIDETRLTDIKYPILMTLVTINNPNYITIYSPFFANLFKKLGKDPYKYLNTPEQFTKGLEWGIKKKIFSENNYTNCIETKINKIVQVENPKYVYDLTIPKTTNFCLKNGLGVADTFHSAGISAKNVTLGFPRAKELFNATTKPSNPTLTVYFTEYNTNLTDLHKIIDKIPQVKFGTLIEKLKIIKKEKYKMPDWGKIFMNINNINLFENFIVLDTKISLEKSYNFDINLKKISKNLQKEFSDIVIIYSPLNLGILHIFIDISKIDNDNVKDYIKKYVIYELKSVIVSGINNITRVYPRKISSGSYPIFSGKSLFKNGCNNTVKTDEWIIDTDGTNLRYILNLPGVDYTKTYSNDVWEIHSIFGIEATRVYLQFEFENIIASTGSNISPRHVSISVDRMLFNGDYRAVSRFGIETSQTSAITRASFEELMKHLALAAVYSETDNLNGTSSNIAVGVKINAGTGMVQVEEIPMIVKKEK